MKKLILYIITLGLFLVSCRAQKEILDVEKNDSLRIEYHTIIDTLIIRDTVYIKGSTITDKESNTHIEFGESGLLRDPYISQRDKKVELEPGNNTSPITQTLLLYTGITAIDINTKVNTIETKK